MNVNMFREKQQAKRLAKLEVYGFSSTKKIRTL
jgi:U3 small nucleolar RNA-associated protein 14